MAPATFVETIALQELISTPDINNNDADGGRRKRKIFKSTGPIFVPIDGVYGGHLLGQSVYAAYKTVDKRFYCHVRFVPLLSPAGWPSPAEPFSGCNDGLSSHNAFLHHQNPTFCVLFRQKTLCRHTYERRRY
ncbi:hypothetical protein ABW19_dt0200577 [Dactylella cylindrospora]|nr:hypothetical protein ABW19_dt0200577 [Dactylella cylindrospora]